MPNIINQSILFISSINFNNRVIESTLHLFGSKKRKKFAAVGNIAFSVKHKGFTFQVFSQYLLRFLQIVICIHVKNSISKSQRTSGYLFNFNQREADTCRKPFLMKFSHKQSYSTHWKKEKLHMCVGKNAVKQNEWISCEFYHHNEQLSRKKVSLLQLCDHPFKTISSYKQLKLFS